MNRDQNEFESKYPNDLKGEELLFFIVFSHTAQAVIEKSGDNEFTVRAPALLLDAIAADYRDNMDLFWHASNRVTFIASEA